MNSTYSSIKSAATCFQPIVIDLPKAAVLNDNPMVYQLTCGNFFAADFHEDGNPRKDGWSITIKNHTNFNIQICSNGEFFINSKKIDENYRETEDCEFIVYCIEDYPHLLCFEKYHTYASKIERLFINMISPEPTITLDTEGIISNISDKVCILKNLNVLLPGFKDEGSFFAQNVIPIDIIAHIALLINSRVNI